MHHLLASGLVEQALDRLYARLRVTTGQDLHNRSRMSGAHLTSILERALVEAVKRRRPREVHDLRRWIASFTAVITEEETFYRVTPAWFEQIKHDCGFAFWEGAATLDGPERVSAALRLAVERYEQTPELERVYRVDEAIGALLGYVVCSIAIAARTQDFELTARLPGLLEPFVGQLDADETAYVDALSPGEHTVHWTAPDGLTHHPIVLVGEDETPIGVIVLAGCTTPSRQMRAFTTRLGPAL